MPKRRADNVCHVLVGNPENRRVLFFQQALQRFGLPPAKVLAYRELLDSKVSVTELLHAELERTTNQLQCKTQPRLILRIESPGENFEVEKRLISRGAGCVDTLSNPSQIAPHAALRLVPSHGRIRYPAQWFAGFRAVMQQIDEALKCFPQIELYSSPDEIPVMFDKRLTSERLQAAGIATPPTLRDVCCYDELKSKMQSLGWNRVFVKLACSSSASGVVALFIDQQHVRAVTPMEIVGSGLRTQFYNNLKIQVYHRESQVRRAVDFLFREGAHIERWLPKSTQSGRGFDLRMVTIARKAAQVVVRTSAGPMTNLHLGNKRGDIELLKRQMGRQKWEAVKCLVEQAAAAFPKSLYVGFDVLLQPGNRHPAILEANAFGDLLPGVLFRGQNTYESEVVARMAVNPADSHAISGEIA